MWSYYHYLDISAWLVHFGALFFYCSLKMTYTKSAGQRVADQGGVWSSREEWTDFKSRVSASLSMQL